MEYEEDNAAKIVAIDVQFLSYDFVAIKGLCEFFFFLMNKEFLVSFLVPEIQNISGT